MDGLKRVLAEEFLSGTTPSSSSTPLADRGHRMCEAVGSPWGRSGAVPFVDCIGLRYTQLRSQIKRDTDNMEKVTSRMN